MVSSLNHLIMQIILIKHRLLRCTLNDFIFNTNVLLSKGHWYHGDFHHIHFVRIFLTVVYTTETLRYEGYCSILLISFRSFKTYLLLGKGELILWILPSHSYCLDLFNSYVVRRYSISLITSGSFKAYLLLSKGECIPSILLFNSYAVRRWGKCIPLRSYCTYVFRMLLTDVINVAFNIYIPKFNHSFMY